MNLQARASKAEDQLEQEGIKAQGEDIVISVCERGDMFTESGERVPVGEPIGYDEGCWRPTRSGRMRVRWGIYREPDGSLRHLLRDQDREEQGLPPRADRGIVSSEEIEP